MNNSKEELYGGEEEEELYGGEEEEELYGGEEEEELYDVKEEEKTFLKKFNKEFEKKQGLSRLKLSKMKKKYNKKNKKKNIHELTIGEILINTKNTYIDIITELISGDFNNGISFIFTKNNRIFYIGVSLLIISFLIYILSFIFSSDNKKINSNLLENDKINIYLTNSPSSSNLDSSNKQDISNNKQDISNNKQYNDEIIQNNKNSESDDIILNTSDSFNISNKIDTSNLKEIQL